tara:strand:- start:653 stop:937 length:285 start_codon:yes stop_codon:yes gene_type:complete
VNFYKKALFITLLIFIFFVALITVLEPVVDRQLSNIFADKKISTKLKNELLKGTNDFTPEKRKFYKNVIKKIYIKWKPLLEEAVKEANDEINKN